MSEEVKALGLLGLEAMIVVSLLLTATALALWFERKFAARLQTRVGPNMVGPAGLLQPVADLVKLLQKEDLRPRGAARAMYNLAPILAAVAAVGAAAVVPFGRKAVADLDIGVLFLLAVGAFSVLPVVQAGWASNNKFALLGGMRAVAQSISYEVPLVLSALVPVILAGSMRLGDIVDYQAQHHWFIVWPFFLGVPAFVLFMLGMLAEANRIPFDIPEAESELVAGVTTEYSGMRFALFYLAEYVHTVVASAVAAALFLGGSDGPFKPGAHWMLLKTFVLFVVVYWIRWSWLRFRSDQLLAICWRILVPASVVLLAATAVTVVVGG